MLIELKGKINKEMLYRALNIAARHFDDPGGDWKIKCQEVDVFVLLRTA